MLIQIDNKMELWIDDSMIMMLGEAGLKSTFTQTRIAEGMKKGLVFDTSFKKGKKSLLLYPSGQSIITHVSAAKIEKLLSTKSDEVRSLRIELEIMKLKMAKLIDRSLQDDKG